MASQPLSWGFPTDSGGLQGYTSPNKAEPELFHK